MRDTRPTVGLKPTIPLIVAGQAIEPSVSVPIAAAARWAATADADARKRDYAAGLSIGALRGKRIGVLRYRTGTNPAVDALFAAALATLGDRGAELVDIAESGVPRTLGDLELLVLHTEFKAGVNAYLATTPPAVTTHSLADLITFNEANAATELKLFGQRTFIEAEATRGLDDPAYLKARAEAKRLAGPEGIDRLLATHGVSMLVAPTMGPAWMTDVVNGDQYSGGSSSQLPAVAGYPHLTVPMGYVKGLPVGLSFIGPAWTDAEVLAAGYAYEQASMLRRAPGFLERSEDLLGR